MTALRVTEIEAAIGYSFKNKELLIQAFTHSSYANEHDCESNERMEFLGDSILGFVISEREYLRGHASEGDMSSTRAAIVSRAPLAAAIEKSGLLGYLRLGVGAAKEDRKSDKFKSNLFEAIVAAIYLDGKNLDECRRFILSVLNPDDLDELTLVNYKGKLQEYIQAKKKKLDPLKYVSEETNGEFVSKVYIDDVFIGEGKARKKKDAERMAAFAALKKLGKGK